MIARVLNQIYETGKFPAPLTSFVHMIHKGKGIMKDTADYRGISLLSTLSIIYTRVLA
jgi:hypothetical protein